MIIAVFLPRVESNTFFRVADNSLISNGDGWVFIGLAVGISLAVWAAVQNGRQRPTVLVLGCLAIAAAIYDGTGDRVALESVNPEPALGGNQRSKPARVPAYMQPVLVGSSRHLAVHC